MSAAPRRLRRAAALVFAGVLLACAGPPELTQPEPPNPEAYWVERSDDELAAAVTQTCEAAVAANKPVLVAFSAPWCVDCRLVRRLEVEPELAAELTQWEQVVVDVGRFDRHEAILEHFGVRAIATWAALQPTSCDQPLTQWTLLDKGRFEPATNPLSKRSAQAFAHWLRAARGG